MAEAGDTAAEEFAARVRAVKERGGRSYEALGRRLNVAASTLHRYCTGTTVPEDFAVVDRLARLCGADEEELGALEESWRRADASRRHRTTGPRGPARTARPARTATTDTRPPAAPAPAATAPALPASPAPTAPPAPAAPALPVPPAPASTTAVPAPAGPNRPTAASSAPASSAPLSPVPAAPARPDRTTAIPAAPPPISPSAPFTSPSAPSISPPVPLPASPATNGTRPPAATGDVPPPGRPARSAPARPLRPTSGPEDRPTAGPVPAAPRDGGTGPGPGGRVRGGARGTRARAGLVLGAALGAVTATLGAVLLLGNAGPGGRGGTGAAIAAPATAPVTASATAPASGEGPAGRPAEAPLPFTRAVASHVWQNGCGHTYLVDRAPSAVAAPPPPDRARAWAGAHRAVHGGETLVRISLQGRSSAAVVVQALHVRVTGRAAPLPWTAYRMDNGCGGALTPRSFAVDLDRPRPLAKPVAGYDGTGEGRDIPAIAFPYTVTAAEPEELLVSARTKGCDCRWYLLLEWSSGGRTGTLRITDEDGLPFRTSGTVGRPVFGYDSPGGRWITDGESGQSG
ncbi:helix-turn-helix domain-containing protein [Streptomyces sp. NPDC093249]|uniref:helix-turn-helix domain-containing protein n=1 Tax=unclassified Streptomyces TaxID=2593676 RepID=UPI0038036721